MDRNQIIALIIILIVLGFLLLVAIGLLIALRNIVRRMIRIIRRTPTRPAPPQRPLHDPEPPQRMPVAPDAQRRAVRPADTHDTARDNQQEGARP